MTTELVELADCPCCDSKAQFKQVDGRDHSETWVACTKCTIRTESRFWLGMANLIKIELATAWNTRALASRAGGCEREAARYRFLRANAREIVFMDGADVHCFGGGYEPGEEIDAAIDVAIAAAPESVAVGS
jgi:hypothetical protein